MRLIDADELINQGYEIVVDGLQYDTCNKSIDIDTIPTAYDIDKVVEELEELKNKDVCDDLDYDVCLYKNICGVEADQSSKLKLDKAIEIVKQGGVGKDVE